jgi:hypothetical protein
MSDFGNLAIAKAIDNLTTATNRVADALHKLGINEAATGMGALEILSKSIEDAGARIADAITQEPEEPLV